MDWFEKRLGTDHAEHVVSRELYNPDALKEQLDAATARAEAAEADARECRAERARYGDMMTEKLAAVEADRDALRSEVATYRKTLDEVSEIATNAVDERDALRDELATAEAEVIALRNELAAARTDIAQLREKAESFPHHCCCCAKSFAPAQLNGLCETCYEDRIA